MCGISGIAGGTWARASLDAMVAAQAHRGPDATGIHEDPLRRAGLGHNRLSIIDLSEAGRQPMATADGRYWIVFNGEIYNYLELRAELADYPFRTRTDSEVALAAYARWGAGCLDRFLGMFALLIWDERDGVLFAARDRFGVKPLHYHLGADGRLLVASEIKALHAAGAPAAPDAEAWSTYLTSGQSDHGDGTFWRGIRQVPAGHALTWRAGSARVECWYDFAERVGTDYDARPLETVEDEYRSLLVESVRLRFRADVPVGINLSGGLDSSTLLGVVQAVQGPESDVLAFTFATGDPRYDETPWVEQMLARTRHPSVVARLRPEDVPELARSVQRAEDEPFGGLPTLAYARLFETARERGVTVLLDGQGMDEQWAGYDYYRDSDGAAGPVQGTTARALRPDCLTPEFRAAARPFEPPARFPDRLRRLQHRDIRYLKIPRALRFNDRASMRASRELREPFLDHRLVELAFRQPPDRKISGSTQKWMLRRVARQLLPEGVVEAPKRPLQTPQREWLRGELAGWAGDCVEAALAAHGGAWLDASAVRAAWTQYVREGGDNSFAQWQWINLGLMAQATATTESAPAAVLRPGVSAGVAR